MTYCLFPSGIEWRNKKANNREGKKNTRDKKKIWQTERERVVRGGGDMREREIKYLALKQREARLALSSETSISNGE